MSLYERSGIWYGRIVFHGTEHRESMGTRNRRDAEARHDAWTQKVTSPTYGAKGPPLSYADMMLAYAASDIYRKLAPKTHALYRTLTRQLDITFAGLRLDDITQKTLRDHKDRRLNIDGVAGSTVRLEFVVLSEAIAHAIRDERATSNPVAPFAKAHRRSLSKAPPRERYLTPAESRLLLMTYPIEIARAVEFAIETGLRRDEQASLVWSDIRASEGRYGTLHVRSGKGGKEREVPLTDRAAHVLAQLPRHPTSGALFFRPSGAPALLSIVARYNRINARLFQMGALVVNALHPGLHWHDLRRTCGCRHLQAGISAEKVALWLGHTDARQTLTTYAFLRRDQVHEVIEQLETQKHHGGAEVIPLRRREG